MKLHEWFNQKSKEYEKDFDFRLETMIYSLTEQISIKMDEKNVNRSALAEKMNASPAYITKILQGSSNFTLRTLLKLADALGQDLILEFKSKQKNKNLLPFCRPYSVTSSIQPSEGSEEDVLLTAESTDTEFPSNKPEFLVVSGGGY